MSQTVELHGGVSSRLVFEITPVDVPDQVRVEVAPAAGAFSVPLKLAAKADVPSASVAAATRKMANFFIASSRNELRNEGSFRAG